MTIKKKKKKETRIYKLIYSVSLNWVKRFFENQKLLSTSRSVNILREKVKFIDEM